MTLPKRRWFIAALTALYLYFLLPATAQLFYELYHLTQVGPVYWGYSLFKAAGYYFGVYEHRLLVCVLVATAIVGIPAIADRLRRS